MLCFFSNLAKAQHKIPYSKISLSYIWSPVPLQNFTSPTLLLTTVQHCTHYLFILYNEQQSWCGCIAALEGTWHCSTNSGQERGGSHGQNWRCYFLCGSAQTWGIGKLAQRCPSSLRTEAMKTIKIKLPTNSQSGYTTDASTYSGFIKFSC